MLTGSKVRGIAALLVLMTSCTRTSYRARFSEPSAPLTVDANAEFLKCHMYDGSLYVLWNWHFEKSDSVVAGSGPLYDSARKLIANGPQLVPLADVELLETDQPEKVPRGGVILMAVVTGASLGMTIFCATNPKACFGSCPTFYARDGLGELRIQAEGFSASVARSLEATDVDSMWTAEATGRTFEVLMTNEALETHVVDSVRLVAAPRPHAGRVLRAGSLYFAARAIHSPLSCASARGDCLGEVTSIDARAYLSPAGDRDLATREIVDLEFANRGGSLGIVVAGRNSLLNTFLFYQALAYMGPTAGDWYMRMNHGKGDRLESFRAIGALLGDVEISLQTKDGSYRAIGSYSEVGPIAREVQVIPIPNDLIAEQRRRERLSVRLTMTAGNWKLDHVGLAELGADPVTPVFLDPIAVVRNDAPDVAALNKLVTPGSHLVTYPGDAYTLHYELPEGDQELFLESRGYYYEWMRKAWLREESTVDLLRLLLDPKGTMQRLAPAYKQIEGEMEGIFWQSRVGRR